MQKLGIFFTPKLSDCSWLCATGLPEVRGDLLAKAAAEGLPGGGDPQAERDLPAEDATQGNQNRDAQQGSPN